MFLALAYAKMEANRLKIAALICANHDTADIIKRLTINRHTVYCVCKHLEERDSLKGRPRSGRPAKLTSKAANATMSMTEFTKMRSVAQSIMFNTIKAAGGMSKRYVERSFLTQQHLNSGCSIVAVF